MKIFYAITGAVLLPFFTSVTATATDNSLDTAAEEKQQSATETTKERRFGDSLFNGNFKDKNLKYVSGDYTISSGDIIDIKTWGAFEWAGKEEVNSDGKTFLPYVGPIYVAGLKNRDLNKYVNEKLKVVFKKEVGVYASLDSATPVQIFVSGFVVNPGLYEAASGSSVLELLDASGGISSEGSYRSIALMREGKRIQVFNLYNFIKDGVIAAQQLKNGDTIVVAKKEDEAFVNQDDIRVAVEIDRTITFAELMKTVAPKNTDSHVRIESVYNSDYTVRYGSLLEAKAWEVKSGDTITYTSDLRVKSIGVRVEGEHDSSKERVLPPNSTLSALVKELELTDMSNLKDIQLYRVSEKEKQKLLFNQSLDALEKSVLTARSGTLEGAQLRTEESALILTWIDKAREITPLGQIVLNEENWSEIVLEAGDLVKIPRKTNIISVSGEVLFPRAIAVNNDYTVIDYINASGGLSQSASTSKVLLMSPNGQFTELDIDSRRGRNHIPNAGDSIMALPDVEVKNMQMTKDITEIIYQIAVAASVVVGV
ncbi:polysaccharide biosynthesis/export family protein [Vibrio crassostreae]|uniref:polysaccharide biosynthesis/export family protein n=1 Tax=Vibrio crassostreae TaxID=246167 RepID=UPI001B315900|nr:SLBB domain-containing protein [Vibrio crassostreae]